VRLSRGARAALWVLGGLVLLFVYVPLVVVAVNSFNSDRTFGWPPPGFTTDWWRAAAQAQGPRDALLTSVQAGLGATALGGVVGTLLGEAGINIADMDVGRAAEAGSAIMVIATTEPTPAELLERLRAVPGIVSVHPLQGD